MQRYPNQLLSALADQLAPVYLVFGDEHQLVLDSLDAIRAKAKQSGFAERTSMHVSTDFNWALVTETLLAPSLFSPKQYLELHLPTGKPGRNGSDALLQLLPHLNQDSLLVIHGERIGKDVQNSKWFKQLSEKGVYVPCNSLNTQAVLSYLRALCQQKSINIAPEALSTVIQACEGNLLAARQEIEKLGLSYPNQPISNQMAEASIINQSRYQLFQLVDAMLAGEQLKMIQVLRRFEVEGVEPIILLWGLVQQAQTLSACFHEHQQQGRINFQKHGIWSSRQHLYHNALSRMTAEQLSALLENLATADIALKSGGATKPYLLIAHLLLQFQGLAVDLPLALTEFDVSMV